MSMICFERYHGILYIKVRSLLYETLVNEEKQKCYAFERGISVHANQRNNVMHDLHDFPFFNYLLQHIFMIRHMTNFLE